MNRLRSGLIGQELSVFAFESEGGELDLDRSDKNHPRFVKLLDRDTMICFATMPMNDAGAPRASPERWFHRDAKEERAAPRCHGYKNVANVQLADRESADLAVRPGFTKRFIGIVVTETRDSRQARRGAFEFARPAITPQGLT